MKKVLMCLFALSITSVTTGGFSTECTPKMPEIFQTDSTKLVFKDARGLDLSVEDISKAAIAKSYEFLVILAFAGDDMDYIDLVHRVTAEQHIGKKDLSIYVIYYDRPIDYDGPITNIFYKGKVTLPITFRSDKYGVHLSTLIRRVYQDHYKI